MAIKYNNQDVKRIYYDGDPVYTVKKDWWTIVWKKPYTVRALPSEGEVSFIVDPLQSDQMLQKVSPYKDLIGISPNGISIDGSVIAQRSGYDQRIVFHYNPIGKVIDYSSLFWNTEPGGTKVLWYGNKPVMVLEGGVTVGSLLVESAKLNGKSYTITHTVVTKGTLKVDFVFGRVDMPGNLKFANFTNLYFNKNTSNPDTSKSWVKVEAQELQSWAVDPCFWYTSKNGNKTGLTISPFARFSIGDPDYDVGRTASQEPTAGPSSIVVGSTVYAGDTLYDYLSDEEYIVPERDADDFYWTSSEAHIPGGSITTTSTSVSCSSSSEAECWCDAKVDFINYTGANVKSTVSTQTFSSQNTWSATYTGTWIEATVQSKRFSGGFYDAVTTTKRNPNAPTSISGVYIKASYTAADRTQGGSSVDGDVSFNLAGPSSLNGYSFYVVYNATYYYNDGRSESFSSYATAGVKAVTQISRRQGGGVCGGTIVATIYGCGLTTTDSVSVGNTSGGGGDASS